MKCASTSERDADPVQHAVTGRAADADVGPRLCGSSPFVKSSESLVLALVVSAFVVATCVMLFPRRIFLIRYFAEVGPFWPPPAIRPLALPIVFSVTMGVLVAGSKALPRLRQHPWRAATGVFVLGVTLNVALVAALVEGASAFYRRAVVAGHGEFLIESVLIQDLPDTIRNYETYVRSRPERIFLAQKGPGVISFFYGLRLIANTPFVRELIEPLAPTRDGVRSWLSQRMANATVPSMGTNEIDDLRYLLALILIAYPFLTYLPVYIVFWLGKTYGDVTLGLLAASLYLFVPVVSLRVAHLDYALFPLLAVAVLAFFAHGVERQRPSFVVLSALIFVAYFTMTLSAVSLLGWLLPYCGLVALERIRLGKRVSSAARESATALGIFALVCAVPLVALHGALQFDAIERYTFARSIQRSWVGSRVSWFVFAWNLLEYFLSFSLIYTTFLFVQQWRSARRLATDTADALDRVALSWLCLFLGLVAFGRQQGETDRLWAFLNPVGCLIAARLLHDSVPSKRLWLPLLLFVLALGVARYQLAYF
jgi:hypothetical protein